jgi:isoquinoline 1-oxidoreductase beta subunit
MKLPGMLHATIERAPTLGGQLVRYDPAAALRVPGVREVRPVTAGVHPGVAVLADDTWSALRGREVLSIEWAAGTGTPFDSERFMAGLPAALSGRQFKVRHEGDAAAAQTQNCTADVRADRAELWVPTQTDVRTLQQAARVSGLPEEDLPITPEKLAAHPTP